MEELTPAELLTEAIDDEDDHDKQWDAGRGHRRQAGEPAEIVDPRPLTIDDPGDHQPKGEESDWRSAINHSRKVIRHRAARRLKAIRASWPSTAVAAKAPNAGPSRPGKCVGGAP